MLRDLNPKGALQEYTQRKYGRQPEYHLVSVTGPDHNPVFRVEVRVHNIVIAFAEANKRKTAESIAAHEALNMLQERELRRQQKQTVKPS